MSKKYCHYEVLWPVMGMPTSEDGLLLSIRPAKEETCSFRMSPTSEQRLFLWKGDRKAGLLMEGGIQMKTKISVLLVVALAVVAGCKYGVEGESAARMPDKWAALTGLPCVAAPDKAELLDESGSLALFAGETAEDSAFKDKEREEHPTFPSFRNSLFLRRRVADGSYEWRLILTTGSDWRIPDGLGRWCSAQTESLKRNFFVRKARFASDGRHLWLVCDTCAYTFAVICSYDVHDRIFRALIDGADVEDAADGTILVKDKKFYPDDDRGAAWHDVWITPDGEIVRKGKITLRGSDL